MDHQFYDNEFEKFLKEEADGYRMYPSEHVWRNIQHEVHGYKKWPALGVISIFIISALLIGTVLIKPHTQTNTDLPVAKNNLKATQKSAVSVISKDKKYVSPLSVKDIADESIEKSIENIRNANAQNFIMAPAIGEYKLNVPENIPTQVQSAENLNFTEAGKTQVNNAIQGGVEITSAKTKEPNNFSVLPPLYIKGLPLSVTNSNTQIKNAVLPESITAYHPKSDFSKIHFDYKYLFADLRETGEKTNAQTHLNFNQGKSNNKSPSPLSKISGKESKFDFQFFITPSISYRRLVDDFHGDLSRSYITALPVTSNYIVDIDNAVQHAPATGYEVGFSLGYNLNSKFAIRSGFQFNVRQYNINAFVHASQEPSSLSLFTGTTLQPNSVTGFRNIAPASPIMLKNRYYEISLPIGVDFRPVNKKISWGIATSLQPTYTFDKEPFIVTTNYKNYKDGSQLIRNLNVNANFETYVGYNTGGYRWQLGPQIRYQVLPSLSGYPIREYLVDYGIKLSLVKYLK